MHKNQDLVDRKKEMILKDFETAFSCYTRHVSAITGIRGLTVTLLTAYSGFLIKIDQFEQYVLVLPILLIILAFFAVEAFERRSMKFLGEEVRRIERVFMIEDCQEFEQQIVEYEFRDIRLQKKISFLRKFRELLICMRPLSVLTWYLFLTITFILMYFAFLKFL